MNNLAQQLNDAVKAVAPIVGVGIGRVADRATWSIQFDPSATSAEKAAAAAVLAAFEYVEPKKPLTLEDVIDVLNAQGGALKAALDAKKAAK